MSTIYLLRHGEIPTFQPRRYIGRQTLPLTPEGRAQMERMAEFLSTHSIDRVVSSPLARCLQGAEIIKEKLGIIPQISPELAEIDLGSWEGLTVAEVRERFSGQYEARGKISPTFARMVVKAFRICSTGPGLHFRPSAPLQTSGSP